MEQAKVFSDLIQTAKDTDLYWSERALLEFVTALNRLMVSSKLSRADLARKLGTSAAYVTKVLRGDVNFTVESMVKISRAVGGRLHIHVAQQDMKVRWFDIAQRQQAEQPEVPKFDRRVYVKGKKINGDLPLAA